MPAEETKSKHDQTDAKSKHDQTDDKSKPDQAEPKLDTADPAPVKEPTPVTGEQNKPETEKMDSKSEEATPASDVEMKEVEPVNGAPESEPVPVEKKTDSIGTENVSVTAW